jgi:hypothetical protein
VRNRKVDAKHFQSKVVIVGTSWILYLQCIYRTFPRDAGVMVQKSAVERLLIEIPDSLGVEESTSCERKQLSAQFGKRSWNLRLPKFINVKAKRRCYGKR